MVSVMLYPCIFCVALFMNLLPTVYCLWQISKIQTCLCVFVGPVFVSISRTFMRSSASRSAWSACPKTGTWASIAGGGGF